MKKVILEIDDRTFDPQVLKSDKPVLVDLWAPWCGPCNSIEPVVEKLAEAYGDQIQFTRCNVDKNPNEVVSGIRYWVLVKRNVFHLLHHYQAKNIKLGTKRLKPIPTAKYRIPNTNYPIPTTSQLVFNSIGVI